MAGQWAAVSQQWLCVAVQVLLWWPGSSWLTGRNPVLPAPFHLLSSQLGLSAFVRAQDSTYSLPGSSFLVVLASRHHRDREEGSIPYSSVVSAPLRLFWIVWNKTFKVGDVKGSFRLPRAPELLTISDLTAAWLYLPRLMIPPWLW